MCEHWRCWIIIICNVMHVLHVTLFHVGFKNLRFIPSVVSLVFVGHKFEVQ